MVFKRLVIAIAVFTLFVAGAFTAFQVADTGQNAAAKTLQTQVNQSVVIEHDTYQYVNTDQYTAGFTDNTTAYYNNSTLSEGSDYYWNESDGTIRFDNSVGTEGETANLTYEYYENTQAVKDVSGPLSVVVEAIGRTGLLAAGLAFVVLFLFFGGFIAQRLSNNNLPRSNR